MSLSCSCDYDHDFDAGDYYYDYQRHTDFSIFKMFRSKRCISCNTLLGYGSVILNHPRVRYPYSDVESRITNGCDLEDSLCDEAYIKISDHIHCERCGEIWLNLQDIGYECLSPSENMEESLKEYHDMTGFIPNTNEKEQAVANKILEAIKNQSVFSKMELLGWKENTVRAAVARQKISKDMAKDLEAVTGIHIKFWLFPGEFDVFGGEVKK